MVGTRGGNEVPLLDETTRPANIAENERKVRAIIELKRNEALGGNKNSTEKGSSQPSRKRKKTNNCTSEVANGGCNLRSQSRLNHDGEDPNNEPIGHGLDDIQANASVVTIQQKKEERKGSQRIKEDI
ncbi:uncharacterized protein LOC125532181 [Triticum urartu]|nr:uncharacterized protein LOC125532181 [Triticum urartu]